MPLGAGQREGVGGPQVGYPPVVAEHLEVPDTFDVLAGAEVPAGIGVLAGAEVPAGHSRTAPERPGTAGRTRTRSLAVDARGHRVAHPLLPVVSSHSPALGI